MHQTNARQAALSANITTLAKARIQQLSRTFCFSSSRWRRNDSASLSRSALDSSLSATTLSLDLLRHSRQQAVSTFHVGKAVVHTRKQDSCTWPAD